MSRSEIFIIQFWHSVLFTTITLEIYVKVKVKVTQLYPTLCNSIDYTVHGILQARILEWVAFPFSRGSSQPRDLTQASHIVGGFFTSWAIGKPWYLCNSDKSSVMFTLFCFFPSKGPFSYSFTVSSKFINCLLLFLSDFSHLSFLQMVYSLFDQYNPVNPCQQRSI